MASSVVSDNFETSTGAIPNMGGADVTTRLCSAWVNFNGTGTVAIRDSYNVSSITDNGTGKYTVNFDTAMANSGYASLLTARGVSSIRALISTGISSDTYSTSSFLVRIYNESTGSVLDSPIVSASVFGS